MASVAQNLQQARSLKEEGNQHFKDGNYPQAIAAYHQIYMYVHGYSSSSGGMSGMPGQTTTPVSPEDMAQVRELKIAHFCNLAMCHMKHGPKYAKAKDNCTKALALDPDNVKALFRRGKCYAQLGALDEAKADLERVLELQADNKDAVRELRMLKGAFDKQRKKEQRKFAGLFDKLQHDTEMEEAAAAAAQPAGAAPSADVPPDGPPATTQDYGVAVRSEAVAVAVSDGEAGVCGSAAEIGERVGDVHQFEPQDVHIN